MNEDDILQDQTESAAENALDSDTPTDTVEEETLPEEDPEIEPETEQEEDSPEEISEEQEVDTESSWETPEDTPEGPEAESSEDFEEETPKKKSPLKTILITILVVAALLAAAGGVGYWYYTEREKPKALVESFLTDIRKMDIDSMKSKVQSSDFSALTDADLLNPAFQDFFKQVNSKMTYRISKVRFNLQEGAAQVTVHIKYIDGTQIYREAISEFLLQMVSTTFYGDEETTQKELARLLQQKAKDLKPSYAEVDLIYPLIKTEDEWKIAALDDTTVRIMSANFKNIQEEVQKTVDSSQAGPGEEATPAETVSQETGSIDMDTDLFSVKYRKHEVASDFAGNPCLLFYYDYTNHADIVSSALVDVHMDVFQHGKELSATIPVSDSPEIENYLKEVKPGETLTICQVFELSDLTSVTVQVEESFSLSGSNVHSQILILN